MVKVIVRAALVLLALISGGLILEYRRCRARDLPASVPATLLEGLSNRLVQDLGPPDSRFRTVAPDLYNQAVGLLVIPPGSLDDVRDSPLEVLVWRRACFFSMERQLIVIASLDSGRIVCYGSASSISSIPVFVSGKARTCN